MSKSAFVSNSLGVAVAASEQLIPRLAVEYKWEERCKRDMREIRGTGGSGGCLRVTPLCLGYIHLCNKVLGKKEERFRHSSCLIEMSCFQRSLMMFKKTKFLLPSGTEK